MSNDEGNYRQSTRKKGLFPHLDSTLSESSSRDTDQHSLAKTVCFRGSGASITLRKPTHMWLIQHASSSKAWAWWHCSIREGSDFSRDWYVPLSRGITSCKWCERGHILKFWDRGLLCSDASWGINPSNDRVAFLSNWGHPGCLIVAIFGMQKSQYHHRPAARRAVLSLPLSYLLNPYFLLAPLLSIVSTNMRLQEVVQLLDGANLSV